MSSKCWPIGVAALVAWALTSSCEARAGGIILVTWGETISHVGDVSAQNRPMLDANSVGYKYEYFGVFWLDLWTWGGTYCVYNGKRYRPIEENEAARLLGVPESELSRPFPYRFPLGLLILGPLVVIGLIASAMDKGSAQETATRFDDARYHRALDIIYNQYAQQTAESPASPGNDEKTPEAGWNDPRFQTAFEAGVAYLVNLGIAREEAAGNLALMVQSLAQQPPQESDSPRDDAAANPAHNQMPAHEPKQPGDVSSMPKFPE